MKEKKQRVSVDRYERIALNLFRKFISEKKSRCYFDRNMSVLLNLTKNHRYGSFYESNRIEGTRLFPDDFDYYSKTQDCLDKAPTSHDEVYMKLDKMGDNEDLKRGIGKLKDLIFDRTMTEGTYNSLLNSSPESIALKLSLEGKVE